MHDELTTLLFSNMEEKNDVLTVGESFSLGVVPKVNCYAHNAPRKKEKSRTCLHPITPESQRQ
jgi:hypothetical protein